MPRQNAARDEANQAEKKQYAKPSTPVTRLTQRNMSPPSDVSSYVCAAVLITRLPSAEMEKACEAIKRSSRL